MKHATRAALIAALTLAPLTAMAQTPTPSGAQSAAPSVNLWYFGGNVGVAMVNKTSATAGIEAGIRVKRNLDLVAEFSWMQNVVTSDTLSKASTIASFLQSSQGQAATSDVKVPAFFYGVGARWVFEQVSERYRPYIIATVGAAHTDIKSTFTLGGTDVTGSLPQYGVTLGQDLTGTSTNFAISPGGGVVMGFGKLYADVGYRLTSISTIDKQTNVNRIVFGAGIRY